MTKRIYNYKTNKLYESTGVYIVNIHEEDDNGNVNDYEFEDRFSSVAEAQSAINDAIERISDKYCDVCDCEVIEDGNTTTINTCDKTFVFEIVDDMSEVSTASRPAPRMINDVNDVDDTIDDETAYESVSSRFAKLRTLFEDENSDENSDDGGDDNADDNTDDNTDNTDDTNDDNADDKSDDEGGEDDEEMKAVVLTVKKGDEEDCKKEMIDAGISEDDIEILEADEDADEVEIRVDVNSVMELKDYLDKKGINLEDEIGGEIVSDDDSDSEDKSDDGDSEDNGDEDTDDFNFDDFGDIFGGDGEGEDK